MDKQNLCQELCNSYGRIMYNTAMYGFEGDPYFVALILCENELITYEKSTGKLITAEFIVLECEDIVIKIDGEPLMVEGYVDGIRISHYDLPEDCSKQFWEITEEFWDFIYNNYPYYEVLEETDTTVKICF